MALHGHARLDLIRSKDKKGCNGVVVKRVEEDNVITGWIGDCLAYGNFLGSISPSKIMPIKQWFGGCLLTSNSNDDTEGAVKSYIAGNNTITACAADDAYADTYLPRGSFNSVDSMVITNGYRFVWDWLNSQGNGVISSICLTRPTLAKTEFRTGSALVDNTPANEQLSLTATTMADGTYYLYSIIDYAREVAYRVSYSSDTITVYERKLNTKRLHLLGSNTGYISETTHTISQSVNNYSAATRTISYDYDSGVLHLLTFVSGDSTLNDYAINTSNWTCTATTHSYAGVKFSNFQGWDSVAWIANGIMIRNGYFYALSDSYKVIAKCSMTNDADVNIDTANPAYTIYSGSPNHTTNGSFVQLPNGSWYKLPTIWRGETYATTALYCPNGDLSRISICKWVNKDAGGDSDFLNCANINEYGTLVTLAGRNKLNVETCHGFVSTINNLSESVRKDADLFMKLTYEITEVTS